MRNLNSFNWNEFRARLLMRGKTIKKFCQENGIDVDRYKNIRLGRVIPKDDEIEIFENVMNGEKDGKKQND